jgi:hypothetical protein|nr:MAG TPA: DNA-packaging protein [Caudoviricetes sp.]
MARPKTNKYKIKEMVQKINNYTDNTKLPDIPILKEICVENDWNYDYIMKLQRDNEELRQSIKRLLMKKEVLLEKGMTGGQLVASASIFSLKQLGWRDEAKIEILEQETEEDELSKAIKSYIAEKSKK